MAAAILSRPRALAAGRSAAYLHDLAGYTPSRPQILVPHDSNARSDIADVARTRSFDRIQVVRRRAFETTSVAETLLFLAGRGHDVEEAFEEALIGGRLDLSSFAQILRREDGARQRGIAQIRDLLDVHRSDRPGPTSSYLERILELLLVRIEVPQWFREHPFTLHGSPSRVDVWIPDWGVVVEADGRSTHARRQAFEIDRRRDNELAGQGVQVVRFTYKMLKNEPAYCSATLLDVGRSRTRVSREAS